MLFLSKHPKYPSLASQHFARCVLSGAIGAPSDDILGGGREVDEELKSPILDVTSSGGSRWSFKTTEVLSAIVCQVIDFSHTRYVNPRDLTPIDLEQG